MDSEILVFGAVNLVAGILAIAVVYLNVGPQDADATPAPPFYDVATRDQLPTDRLQQ